MSEVYSNIATLQEEKLRLIETIPGGVGELLLAENGPVILQATDRFYEIIGHTKEQMEDRGNQLCDVFYKPDLPAAMSQLKMLLEDKKTTCSCTFRVLFPNGTLHWISFRGTIYKTEERHCVTVIILNNDIEMQKRREAEVARAKLELALTVTGHAVFEYDMITKNIYAHKGLEAFGVPTGVVMNASVDCVKNEFVYPEDAEQLRIAQERLLAGEPYVSYEARIRSDYTALESPYVWVRITLSTITNDKDMAVTAVGVIESIHKQRTFEHALSQEAQFRKAFTESSLMAYEVNITQNTVQRISGTRGVRLEELRNSLPNPSSYRELLEVATKYLVLEEDRERFLYENSRENLIQVFQRGDSEYEVEYRRLTMDGGVYWTSVSLQIVLDQLSGDILAYTYHRDIQERKQVEQDMREQISKDALTGLLNRTAAEQMVQVYLQSLVPSGRIQAFLMMDLNHFKDLNDTYGHLIGDHCLIAWAQSLKSQFRKDDLVARMGGDEFAVLLKNLPDEHAAVSIAQKLIHASKAIGVGLKIGVETTVSIGIAFAPRHGTDFESLYKRADEAMYLAKRSGDSKISVYEEDVISFAAMLKNE